MHPSGQDPLEFHRSEADSRYTVLSSYDPSTVFSAYEELAALANQVAQRDLPPPHRTELRAFIQNLAQICYHLFQAHEEVESQFYPLPGEGPLPDPHHPENFALRPPRGNHAEVPNLAEFKSERYNALLSLDPEQIIAFMDKYNIPIPTDEETLWVNVHRARTALLTLPYGERLYSKFWLSERGKRSLDPGDLHT